MKLENIAVILVEPRGPINIGACCRSMMNFAFSDLRIVNPAEDFQSKEARKMALNGKEILYKAGLYPDLKSATADIHITFGTTRRFGKHRKSFISPEETADRIGGFDDSTTCGLVFGREDTGLTTNELEICQHFVTIPTGETFPSLNLSHAVTLLLWEISKAMKPKGDNTGRTPVPATGEELEQMYAHMKTTLLGIEYLNRQNPDHLLRTYRRIFGRAGLSSRDVRIIRGLLSRIDWIKSRSEG